MNKIITLVTVLTISLISFSQSNNSVFFEAKNFENKGGWVEFGEPTAPEIADKMTMGSSVQWYSVEETNRSDSLFFSMVNTTLKICRNITKAILWGQNKIISRFK